MPKLKAQSRRLCVKDRRLVCGCAGTGVAACCSAAGAVGFYPISTGTSVTRTTDFSLVAAYTASGWTWQAGGGSFPQFPDVTANADIAATRTQTSVVSQCTNDQAALSLRRNPGGWQPQTVASGVTVLSQTIEYTTQDLYDGSVGPGVQTAGGIWSAVVDLFHNKTSTTTAEALVFQDAGFDAAGVVARAVMAVEPMFAYYDANSNSALCVGMNVSVLVDSAGKMRLGASSADGVVTGAASITGFSPGHFTLGFDLLFPRRKVSFANPLYNAGGRYTGTLVVGGNMQSCTPPVVQPDTNAAACASMIYQGTNLSYPPFPIPPAPGPVALPIVEPTDNPIDAGGLLLP